jgi:hypothetical protein
MNLAYGLVIGAIVATGCTTMGGAAGDSAFASCAAYKPAYDVTDEFMRTFNTKDAEAWGKTFHFPSVRIASGNVRIINGPQDLETGFASLGAQGWDRSDWAKRQVVQCGPNKAHMLTTFVRYRADSSVLSQFDSLYIVEFKNGRWALTARSSFAP